MSSGRVTKAMTKTTAEVTACTGLFVLVAFGTGACVSPRRSSAPPPLAPADIIRTERFDPGLPEPPPLPASVLSPQETEREEEADAPEQVLDLATVLELAGASNLQIAFARERLSESRARLDAANVLWLPELWAGIGYNKHEGRLQETQGRILEVSRTAFSTSGGVGATLDFTDAFLTPRAAAHDVEAAAASEAATINDALVSAALAWIDLMEAQADGALARQDIGLAQELVELTEGFVRSGQGLESDAARARSELVQRREALVRHEHAMARHSASLATLIRLDPTKPLRAAEADLVPFVLVPEAVPLKRLVAKALAVRPEIREAKARVEAAKELERREELRPFIPELRLAARAGGLGGGTGSALDRFGSEGEFSVGLVWTVRSLGFGEGPAGMKRTALRRQAAIALTMTRDEVAHEVTVAWQEVRDERRRIGLAVESIEEANRSLELNMRRIRGAEGLPIEVLQAMQASATARHAYVDAVAGYNRAQIHLLHAIGRSPEP